ncbi:LysR family transcriptional regulator [Curvivirga aplysinae]|uniref:LysR family transcriptional regulator n=1 Tax=Curvivirga aplysinae TaxID=2529852 RepID=UPI0012BBF137|nr:LysR family transcriptional regulator [Curvivirga aplysinae]MTI09047.1 LysR family transcriptional regulator [Curvivirga aplysinae]
MDKVGELSVFVKVVEEGGFSSAARAMSLTPSAVSKQIGRLEDRLGVRLINRTTRSLSLTPEGRSFFERCRTILTDIEDAESIVTQSHSTPRGSLRITTGVAFGRHQITPLLPEFLERYPDVSIELIKTDSIVDLVEQGIDAAIRFGELADSSMVARFLARSRRAIVASPEYLEKHGVPQHPDELEKHNCLTFFSMPQLNEWVFRVGEEEVPYTATGNFSANNGESIHDMVLNGGGIARLAEFLVAKEVEDGKLIRVLTDFYRDIEIPIHAVYPSRRHLSPKLRCFVDFLVEKFSPVPPWERLQD